MVAEARQKAGLFLAFLIISNFSEFVHTLATEFRPGIPVPGPRFHYNSPQSFIEAP